MAADPTVGVQDPTVERLAATLEGRGYKEGRRPTAATPLGYLMPDPRQRTWPVVRDGQVDAMETQRLLGDLERHGLPYSRSLVSRVHLKSAVEQDLVDRKIFRLPILLGLLGDHKGARKTARKFQRKYRSDPGPAPPAYESYVERLCKWLDRGAPFQPNEVGAARLNFARRPRHG